MLVVIALTCVLAGMVRANGYASNYGADYGGSYGANYGPSPGNK